MKKILSMLLVLSMLLSAAVALAEDGMGVQVIGGPEAGTGPVSLDDVIIGTGVEIPGYGIITPTDFRFKDILTQYQAGRGDDPFYGGSDFKSGEEAEYAVLSMDILNTMTKTHQYIGNCSVIVVYDDTYEYGGWCYQRNYNNKTSDRVCYGGVNEDCGKQNTNWVIDPADNFEIDPMHQGHYVFGCTLPNAVVNSEKPLRLVITIDGNELTYNIRK